MADDGPSLKRIKIEPGVEQWDGSMACMMCQETIRVPGGEPDALTCVVCEDTLFHRSCAGEWVDKCPTCNGNTIVKWTRPEPPGPSAEVIDVLDDEPASGERAPVEVTLPALGSEASGLGSKKRNKEK